MASPPQSGSENGPMHHGYSRKQKSLGLLCSNFLRLYNRDDVDAIGLDDAANKLGVERRRIYDIVNVLESVGVLARKAKNQYTWKGFKAIPKALTLLKEEGLKENLGSAEGRSGGKFQVLDFDDDVASNPDSGSQPEPNSSGAPKSDNRREKSLGLLTQNFVKLFLCSGAELISLDEAAKCLLGDGLNAVVMRTKVRRLYDIANVLSSMQLIEKTNQTETRKPAFRWLGWRERMEGALSGFPFSTESRKRAFGTDLSNVSLKRTKVEYPAGEAAKHKNLQVKTENLENEFYATSSEQEPKSSARNYRYGPFAPVTVAKVGVAEQKNTKRVHDLDALSTSYRPQYHNQALKDLFDHYVDAWSSWYSEVAGRASVEQVS